MCASVGVTWCGRWRHASRRVRQPHYTVNSQILSIIHCTGIENVHGQIVFMIRSFLFDDTLVYDLQTAIFVWYLFIKTVTGDLHAGVLIARFAALFYWMFCLQCIWNPLQSISSSYCDCKFEKPSHLWVFLM